MEKYIFSRLAVIIEYFEDNIKTLESKKVTKLDKEIARDLMDEKVRWLIKDFVYLKLYSSKEQVLRFQYEILHIQNMLVSYLSKMPHDIRVNQTYKHLLVIL